MLGGSVSHVRRINGRAIGGIRMRSNRSLSTTWSPAATHISNSCAAALSRRWISAIEKS
jgi:hypothetical protein